MTTGRATGRPRAGGASPTGLGTRTDILHASARLFCTVGYGGTSTHAIAKAAGIRQASVYHHFQGKPAILLELLLGTVLPSVQVARALLGRAEDPRARLWALCVSDVRLLSAGEVNVGSLYLLPELDDQRFAPFHELRLELESAYTALVVAAGAPREQGGRAAGVALDLVESVILQRRRRPESVDAATAPFLADAVLRTLDVPSVAIPPIRSEGERIAATLPAAAGEADRFDASASTPTRPRAI